MTQRLHAIKPGADDGLVARDAYLAPVAEDDATDLRLDPLQRLRLLCDEGSLRVLRSSVTSERMGAKARPGDGVVGGSGTVAGRLIYCFAQDASFAGGSVGTAHAETIVRIQRLAGKASVPVIGLVESGGARMQEGLAALDGYARIFSQHVSLSGRVPQISVITGTSAGGGCYSPALTDFVVMTEAARMFLTGPAVVREVTGQSASTRELGGTPVHVRNGVCHFAVHADAEAILLVRRLLAHLPQNAGMAAPRSSPVAPEGPDPGDVVPLDPRRIYDMRAALLGIVDGGSLLEVSSSWARNLVTAFARIDGRSIGIVANQPKHLGGVIDADASQKGARFVQTCNAFGIPLAVFVDTPGFLPGVAQEAMGVIRHGAKLLHAFTEATVPRCTVVLRKAFGGAYITMNSKELGADLTLVWPHAQLGIMGAHQAVGIINRREIEHARDPAAARDRLAADYATRHLGAEAAARAGHVDDVIRPGQTREALASAFGMAGGHRGARRRTGNLPL
jgi:acetyl-CoA carboxylase carboxyltransferase component